MAAYLLVKYQAAKFRWNILLEHLDNLNLTLIAGVILGGRLGYVLFYNPSYYLQHPLEVFATWQGGMSFHGGCIGVLLCGGLFCRRHKIDFWKAADLYVVTIPIGLGLGRIGNFMNAELFGRVTNSPWGMIFPNGGPLPRHPSQIYEVLLEGVLLFIILWSLKARPWQNSKTNWWPHGSMLALFLILYGFFRFMVEFVREPDPQLGILLAGMTMGQLLSLTMLISGILLWWFRRKKTTEVS
jgi:phosphatidylglycerol:prolipoprotein diacylglycerol transferase